MKTPIYLIPDAPLPDDFVAFLDQVEKEKEKHGHPDNNWNAYSDFVFQYIVRAWNSNNTNVTEIVTGIIESLKNSSYENWIREIQSC
jgi:hypothetical protein